MVVATDKTTPAPSATPVIKMCPTCGQDTSPIDPLQRLTRDLKAAASTLSESEARYLVDYYYVMQDDRKRAHNQVRAMENSEPAVEPHEIVDWVAHQTQRLEDEIKKALGSYASSKLLGRWAQEIVGIGPVIAAGLLAHIDITKAPAAGHIWRFAGLDPTVKWLGKDGAASLVADVRGIAAEWDGIRSPIGEDEEAGDPYALSPEDIEQYYEIVTSPTGRGDLNTRQITAIASLCNRRFTNILRLARNDEGRITPVSMTRALAKRPYNAKLKVLCWKIGESFVKVCNNPNDTYGRVYVERKDYEWDQNISGALIDQAKGKLAQFKIDRSTDAYKWYSGQVTPSGAGVFLEQLAIYNVLSTEAKRKTAAPKPVFHDDGNGQPMLPPGHIQSRAKRYAVKLFLSHYQHVAYEIEFGEPPANPYILNHPGHMHFIAPPNWPMQK